MRLITMTGAMTMATIPDTLAIALEYHQAGHLTAAEQLCQEVLAANPNQAEAWNLLGVVIVRIGGRGTGADCFRRAVTLRPDWPEANYNLGWAFGEQGKPEEAALYLRRAIELKPDYVEAHDSLGAVLQGQRKVEEAVACHRRAIELNPTYAAAHNNLGIALAAQGEFAAAVASYRRALQWLPDFPAAYSNLGLTLQGQGKLDEAAAACRRARAQAELPRGLAEPGQGPGKPRETGRGGGLLPPGLAVAARLRRGARQPAVRAPISRRRDPGRTRRGPRRVRPGPRPTAAKPVAAARKRGRRGERGQAPFVRSRAPTGGWSRAVPANGACPLSPTIAAASRRVSSPPISAGTRWGTSSSAAWRTSTAANARPSATPTATSQGRPDGAPSGRRGPLAERGGTQRRTTLRADPRGPDRRALRPGGPHRRQPAAGASPAGRRRSRSPGSAMKAPRGWRRWTTSSPTATRSRPAASPTIGSGCCGCPTATSATIRRPPRQSRARCRRSKTATSASAASTTWPRSRRRWSRSGRRSSIACRDPG